jgi:hypothetical protein
MTAETPQPSEKAAYVQRMCVGIFAPAPLGTLTVAVVLNSVEWQRLDREALWGLPLAIIGGSLYAYVLVGAQSVLYAVLMEHLINRRLRGDAEALAASAFLGALVGATAALMLSRWEWEIWPLAFLSVVGAAVGFVVGKILRRMHKATNSVLMSDTYTSPLPAEHGAAKRGR